MYVLGICQLFVMLPVPKVYSFTYLGITFAAKKGKHTATELQGVLLANMKIPTGLVWDYYTEEVAEMLRRNYDISLTAKDVSTQIIYIRIRRHIRFI